MTSDAASAEEDAGERRATPAIPPPLPMRTVVVELLRAQSLRHPGMSNVWNELLTHEQGGNELCVREAASLVGCRLADLVDGFPSAVPLGIARQNGEDLETQLCPAGASKLQPGDRVVVMAPSHDASLPSRGIERGDGEVDAGETVSARPAPDRRFLVLGWNHEVPSLLRELEAYEDDLFGPSSREIAFRPARDYGLAGRARGHTGEGSLRCCYAQGMHKV